MAKYRVRVGARLAINGEVVGEGTVVELPRAVALDHAVIAAVEEIDDAGQVVPPQPLDELARFRTHERVGVLRERLVAAQATVEQLKTLLADEEQKLANEVAAAARPAKAAPRASKE